MGTVLPVWWTEEFLEAADDDPIGCPVSTEAIDSYLQPLLPFVFTSSSLEFMQKGGLHESKFWLWAFYDNDGYRWNLIVFSDLIPRDGSNARTWMCADRNPYSLNDDDYVLAIYNKEY